MKLFRTLVIFAVILINFNISSQYVLAEEMEQTPEEWFDEQGNTYWYAGDDTVNMIKSAVPRNREDTLKIPGTIIHNGKKYKVSCIGDNRFCDENGKRYALVGKGYKKIVYSKNVKEIATGAHSLNETIEEVTFLSNDIAIGDYAFSGCSHLKRINGFQKISSIRAFAFSGTALKKVKIGDKVKIIEESAFNECKQLTQITVSPNLKVIDAYAFIGCGKLNKVVLKKGLKRIEENAFTDCKILKKVNIPSTVTYIDGTSFLGCKNIKLSISKKNKKYCVKGNWLLSKNKKTLVALLKMNKTIVIPSYVKVVGFKAINNPNYIMKNVVSKNKKLIFKTSFPDDYITYYYPKGGKKWKNGPTKQVAYKSIKIKNGKVKVAN